MSAIPAGNSDSNFPQKKLNTSVSSSESKKDHPVKSGLESAKSVSESTKAPVSTNSGLEVSSSAGITAKMYTIRG